jgi:hypothetical protein
LQRLIQTFGLLENLLKVNTPKGEKIAQSGHPVLKPCWVTTKKIIAFAGKKKI